MTMIEHAALAPLQLFTGEFLMWALVFFALAIIAGLAGWQGVAGMSMSIGKLLVLVFLVLAVIALVL